MIEEIKTKVKNEIESVLSYLNCVGELKEGIRYDIYTDGYYINKDNYKRIKFLLNDLIKDTQRIKEE